MPPERTALSHLAPVLVVHAQESTHRLEAGRSYVLGRDPQSAIVFTDSRVSWRHALLRFDRDAWVFEDSGSTNGTFMGAQRVDRVRIDDGCILRFGHVDDGPVVLCTVTPAEGLRARPDANRNPSDAYDPLAGGSGPGEAYDPLSVLDEPRGLPGVRTADDRRPSVDRRPTNIRPLARRVLSIGRSADNDIVVADLDVSRRHAELRNVGIGRYEIVDVGSHNGTYVNGERVTSARLTEQDIVSVGHTTFRLSGDELREFVDDGAVPFTAHDIVVRTPKGKVLLDHVTFPIAECSLVAIVGPSGAGKSTLLGALTGAQPPTEGSVTYDNRDLHTNYAELRHRIGLVPQQDILHTQLSARRALRYAAELRFPGDTVAAERNGRVAEAIEELGLTQHAATRIDTLSGGQRKRVSVALELLTKPSLLFLDEPTSGLDPGLDKAVMRLMRDLAHDGRTVVVVTHSVANLDVCDRLLVLAPGGRVAFYGPPGEALDYFGQSDWADVFTLFEHDPGRDWAGEFQGSPQHARYVADHLRGHADTFEARGEDAPPAPQGPWAQFSTLCRRQFAVLGADRKFLVVLALLPIVVGALVRALPAPLGLAGPTGRNPDAETLLLTLVIGACFVGGANSVRELVKERPIYRRERAAGLSTSMYLCSKVAVLGLVTGLQAVLLVVVGLVGRPLPAHGAVSGVSPLFELMLAIAVLSIASMVLGLVISSLVNTSEEAMPLLVLLSMAQVIFSGALVSLPGRPGLEELAWLSPSRWGLAAAADTVDLSRLIPAPPGSTPDPLWRHQTTTWLLNIGVLVMLGALCALLTGRRLRRLDPGRTSRRR